MQSNINLAVYRDINLHFLGDFRIEYSVSSHGEQAWLSYTSGLTYTIIIHHPAGAVEY